MSGPSDPPLDESETRSNPIPSLRCLLCCAELTKEDTARDSVCESCLNADKRFTLARVQRLISLGDDLTKCDPLEGVGWSQVRHLAGELYGHRRTDKELLDRVVGLISSDTGKIREAVFVMSLADAADALKRSLSKEIAGAGKVANSPNTKQETPESEEGPDSEENSANRYDQRRASILKELPKYQRQAYFTLQLIQAKHERKLKINEAFQLLSEDGIPDDIELTGELKAYVESGELEDYELPRWGAWDKAQREARSALDEPRKESRSGRPTGRSIARPDEIE